MKTNKPNIIITSPKGNSYSVSREDLKKFIFLHKVNSDAGWTITKGTKDEN